MTVRETFPQSLNGLIDEEMPADEFRPETASQETRELENIYRALDAIFADEQGAMSQEMPEPINTHGILDESLAEEPEETAQEQREMEDIHRALDEIFAETPQCSSH